MTNMILVSLAHHGDGTYLYLITEDQFKRFTDNEWWDPCECINKLSEEDEDAVQDVDYSPTGKHLQAYIKEHNITITEEIEGVGY